MNFQEAVTETIRITKRPDKEQDTMDAINEAIAFAALRNFAADLTEITLPIDQTLYQQRLDLTNTVYWNRFRKIEYIRPSGYKVFLKQRAPMATWKNGVQLYDVYYRSGNGIIINLSSLQSTLEIGYYQYHLRLTKPTDQDWMLDEIWPGVKAYALARVFGAIGDDSERARYDALAVRLIDGFTTDLMDGTSRG